MSDLENSSNVASSSPTRKSTKKGGKSELGHMTWPSYVSKKTEELKQRKPNQSSADRKLEIRELWKSAPENSKIHDQDK